jgi:hypothetical protein
MGFTDDINKFVIKCEKNSDRLVRGTVFGVYERLIQKSPVGNPSLWEGWNEGGVGENPDHWLVKAGFVSEGYVGGHYRNNWQIGVDILPKNIIEFKGRLSMQVLSDRERATVPNEAAGHIFYLTNNTPYAWPIEDGHSKNQAPQGVAGLTAMEFNGIVSEEVSKLK